MKNNNTLKCLNKKCKGRYCLTNEKDNKGFILLKCDKCGEIAI